MLSQRLTIRNGMVLVVLLSLIAGIAMLFFTAKNFTVLANQSEKSALREVVKTNVFNLLADLQEISITFISDLDSEEQFRQASRRADATSLKKILRDQYFQYLITANKINLVKQIYFDKNFQPLVESINPSFEKSNLESLSCDALPAMLRQRQGVQKLQVVRSLCSHNGELYLSVMRSTGGLVPRGYVQVFSLVAHKLKELENVLGNPVQLVSNNGEIIWQSESWVVNSDDKLIIASYVLEDDQATDSLQVNAERDHSEYLNNFDNAIRSTVLLSLLFVVPALLFSLWLVHRVMLSLKELQSSARSLVDGNYQPMTNSQFGEINSLAVSFNTMAETVSSLISELQYENEEKQEVARKLKENQKSLELAVERANEAARAKSEFLANMSHEIRTPMNGVLGMLSILRNSNIPEEQKEYVDTAYSSGETLMILLNDILDFSKMEAGKMNLESVRYNLRKVVEDIASLMSENAFSKGLELSVDIPSDVPVMLMGDPTRIRQMLSNLLGNAIKFTTEGEVVVRVRLFSRQGDNVIVKVEVKDTGIGVPESAQTDIFDSFSQADGSTTRKFGGTGLGLSITGQLARLMGGDVGVESDGATGSIFWFTLAQMVSDDQTEETDDHNILTLPRRGMRFLIVDDNATNRKILEHQIDSKGIAFDSVVGGYEALEKVEQRAAIGKPYDVILLDMMMPGIDGARTAKKLHERYRSQRPAVLMLTSMLSSELGDVENSSGIDICLHKPVRQSALFHSIAKLLSPEVDKPEAKTVEVSTDRELSDKRILVVEDHNINRRVAEVALKNLGYPEVSFAEDGKQAVELVSNNHFDIVLMDCQMPIMDGFEATRAIRSFDNDKKEITIIAMTANAMEGDRERCVDAGMDDYLAKPISQESLEAMLEKWFSMDVASRRSASQ